MILADLDRELARQVAADVARGALPPQATRVSPGRTWRQAPDQNPASFATSIAVELAAIAGRQPAKIADTLAAPLRDLPWVAAAEAGDRGYLTITVTARALGQAAARLAATGAGAARSTTLAGTTATVRPWPDPAAAGSWREAWQAHRAAMTGRLAEAAGARVTVVTITGERGKPVADAAGPARSPVAGPVAWFGVASVRYALARTSPGRVPQLGPLLRAGAWGTDPLTPVRQAHFSAASTLRWAADLHVPTGAPGEVAGDLLSSPAERALLGLLQWLPVRVAAAARHRPHELPRFLEAVADAWLVVQQEAPALPFRGPAATKDPAVAGARLMLADAVRTVLVIGLMLTGAASWDEHD